VNQETQVPNYNDDEIDLFELFETLWREKLAIIAFVLMSSILGAGYTVTAKKVYEVKSTYTQNSQFDTALNLSSYLQDWTVNKNNSYSLMTSSPLDLEFYNSALEKALDSYTSDVLQSAKLSLHVMENMPIHMQSTESVALEYYEATKAISAIEVDGLKLGVFSSVSIEKTKPKAALILALSVVLGGMLGVVFVLIRQAVRNRKVKTA
jgi:LPS O-antigen subunit length determinant protein (WzzB/FepE family)